MPTPAPTSTPTSTPTLVPAAASPGQPVTDAESSTRDRILHLVVEEGPVSVVQLGRDLELTTAGVRRHVAALLDAGEIIERAVPVLGRQGRGRPPRRYVATSRGQAVLTDAYSELAAQALTFLADIAGEQAVRDFADQRVAELGRRHAGAVAGAVTVADRVAALAEGLSADGYAASVRPLPGGRAVQLCQGHCPVQAVAARYPQLCESEARLFADLLGVQVQRLSTLAAGGHVCTTHVSLTIPDQRAPSPVTVEGTR